MLEAVGRRQRHTYLPKLLNAPASTVKGEASKDTVPSLIFTIGLQEGNLFTHFTDEKTT